MSVIHGISAIYKFDTVVSNNHFTGNNYPTTRLVTLHPLMFK